MGRERGGGDVRRSSEEPPPMCGRESRLAGCREDLRARISARETLLVQI